MRCPSCGQEVSSHFRFCNECGTNLAAPPDPASPPSSAEERAHEESLAGHGFVGRRREMGVMREALEDAISGQGRLLMLVGEPGIGKSRTAEEFAAYSESRDAQVLWGRCHEQKGMPPYWPWVQALRAFIRGWPAEQLRSEMGANASDIAEIVAEVRQMLPDLEPPPSFDSPEQARFRLFDSITTFLKNASQSRPLVLILDDLHWADKPSLLMLEYLGQELSGGRLLVVGTYRDVDLSRQHPLSETLGQLTRARLFQRVVLRGLSLEEVEGYVVASSGIRPPREFVDVVHSHTEGNPLFVGEVVRMLQQEGALVGQTQGPETQGPAPASPAAGTSRQVGMGPAESWTTRIPEGVREVIGRRLNQLSDRSNQALSIASAIGREFEIAQLAPLMEETSEDQVFEALEEALSARIIEELPRAAGCYQFTHALIQQTLTDEMSTTRKVRLHARIAQVLEGLYQDDAQEHAAELAYHFSEAVTVSGPEKFVRYSSLAGERALDTYAWEEALTHFQQALAAKDGQPMDAETAALLFGLGRAQAATLQAHQVQETVASLRRAFDYYAEAGDVERAVAVAEYPCPIPPGQATGMAQLIVRALELVPPDSHAAGRLLSQYVRILVIEEGDYQAAQAAFPRALEIARREGDEALEMRILASATAGDVQYLRLQASLVKSLRAIELAGLSADPRTEADARYYAALGLWWMGHHQDMRLQAEAALAPAGRLRDHYLLAGALWLNELAGGLAGEWESAREFNDRCLQVSPMDPRPLYSRALMECQLGDSGQSEPHLERFVEVLRLTAPGPSPINGWAAMAIPMIAHVTGKLDHLDVAEACSRAISTSPAAVPYVATMNRAGLGMLAVLRRDAAAAEAQYDALESGQGVPLPGAFMSFVRIVPASFMSRARLLGLLAQTMGRPGPAASHFEDALAFSRGGGFRPELAWTCHDYAGALLARGDGRPPAPEDRVKALSLLDEAKIISHDLGMTRLEDRVDLLQRQTGALPERAPAYPDGLTQREAEVLKLLATGKTDRQIAEDLFISVGTASTHVRNILSKTGSANRTEATAYAARQGLT